MKFNAILAIGMTASVAIADAIADAPEGGWWNQHRHRSRVGTWTRSGRRTRTATTIASATTDVPTITTGAPVSSPTDGEGEGEGEEGGSDNLPVATASPSKSKGVSIPTATGGSAVPTAVPSSAPPTNGGVWQPKVGESWQIILSSTVDPARAIAPDVSVFDLDMDSTPKTVIDQLKAKGKRVICYFSAGSSENFRSDNSQLLPYVGSELEGWPGENWLAIKNPAVRAVMKARIARAAEKGCDAIDPDNMDGYGNKNGLGLTKEDTIDYVKFLSAEAGALGMSMGLKNAGDVIKDVLPYVHFSVNEQCNEYNECGTFAQFITAGKPVFNIEYVDSSSSRRTKRSQRVGYTRAQRAGFTKRSGSCPSNSGFSSVVKNMSLDGWIKLCNGVEATTATGGSVRGD